jgi:hypothetical protein
MTGNPPSVYDGTAFGQHLFARPAIADEQAQGRIERRRTSSADSTAAGVMGHSAGALVDRFGCEAGDVSRAVRRAGRALIY